MVVASSGGDNQQRGGKYGPGCCLHISSCARQLGGRFEHLSNRSIGISGLVVEYIVAIDVTRVRFPADALFGAVGRMRGAHAEGSAERASRHASCGSRKTGSASGCCLRHSPQRARIVNWAHGVVVSHPLRMRKALGSIPSVSIFPSASCESRAVFKHRCGAVAARLWPQFRPEWAPTNRRQTCVRFVFGWFL